jgi:hypothetical protein
MDRLVAANSWPFLMYGTDNRDPQGKQRITLKVVNAGVGPARIQTFEVWWRDQPVASADELLQRCCVANQQLSNDPNLARALHLVIGLIAPGVLRGGDSEEFITLERTDTNADVWEHLNTARLEIKMRACFCSVFDECWVTSLVQTSARRIAACPAAKVPFGLPPQWLKPHAPPEGGSN